MLTPDQQLQRAEAAISAQGTEVQAHLRPQLQRLAALFKTNLPAGEKVKVVNQIVDFANQADNLRNANTAEQNWLQNLELLHPDLKIAEQTWLQNMPIDQQLQIKQVIATLNPVERDRLNHLMGQTDLRQAELLRKAKLSPADRQREQLLPNDKFALPIESWLSQLPPADQQAERVRIAGLTRDQRLQEEALIISLSATEHARLNKLPAAQRAAELTRLRNGMYDPDQNIRQQRHAERTNARPVPAELDLVSNIATADRAAFLKELRNLATNERVNVQIYLARLSPAGIQQIATLPAAERMKRLTELAGMSPAERAGLRREEAWLNAIALPAAQQEERDWLNGLGADDRNAIREFLDNRTADEGTRINAIFHQPDLRRAELLRLARLNPAQRQAELQPGNMIAPVENWLNQLPSADQQAERTRIAGLTGDQRRREEALIISLSATERARLNLLPAAQRDAELTRLRDAMYNTTPAAVQARHEERLGIRLIPGEANLTNLIADPTARATFATELQALNPDQRANLQWVIMRLNSSARQAVANLPPADRRARLNQIAAMTADEQQKEIAFMNHNISGNAAELINTFSGAEQTQVLNWYIGLPAAEKTKLAGLPRQQLERLKLMKHTVQLNTELTHLNTTRINKENVSLGRTPLEDNYLQRIATIYGIGAAHKEEQRLLNLGTAERTQFQANLRMLDRAEIAWITALPEGDREAAIQQFLQETPTERNTRIAQYNEVAAINRNLVAWIAILPADQRTAEITRIKAAQTANPNYVTVMAGLSPGERRHFLTLNETDRAKEVARIQGMTTQRERDEYRASIESANMDPALKTNVNNKLNEIFDYDNLTAQQKLNVLQNDWNQITREFPQEDLAYYKALLENKAKVQGSLVRLGGGGLGNLSLFINNEQRAGRLSADQAEVMRLRLKLFEQMQDLDTSFWERILGKQTSDWLANVLPNLRYATPAIKAAILLAVLTALGGGIGLAAGGVGAAAIVGGGTLTVSALLRLPTTHKEMSLIKTANQGVRLAQAERRVAYDNLTTYHEEVLGTVEAVSHLMQTGKTIDDIERDYPEVADKAKSFGIITNKRFSPEAVMDGLIKQGSKYVDSVSSLEANLKTRRDAIRKQTNRADVIKTALGGNTQAAGAFP